MTTYKNETTEALFQMLKDAQTDYYNKFTYYKDIYIDYPEIKKAEGRLLKISHELEERGESPLGW